ncbi:MAG: tetratricopeptide repeat protein [Candidatus Electrothrix sp. EH2]|nr:tetratricopeptide repeat protein [Candidatus Electrothrix sp. EH2]
MCLSSLYKQSLAIRQKIGDRTGEAVTSRNIGMIYKDQGDLTKAEQYISRAVQLAGEIGHPNLEIWKSGVRTWRSCGRRSRGGR